MSLRSSVSKSPLRCSVITGWSPACSQTFLAHLDKKNEECGYAGYLDKYVKYPPAGPLPLPGGSLEVSEDCDLWAEIFDAARIINPAFNDYHIFDMVCLLNFDFLPNALNALPSILTPGMLSASRKFPCLSLAWPL